MIAIKAPPERVYRALTTASELATWFKTTVEGGVATGNKVWMTSQGQRFRVEFVEMTPPVRFVWRWHPGAMDPAVDYSKEARTTVTFTLEPAEGGTLLHVSETGFDLVSLARRASVYEDNSTGWTEVLGWLREYVEKENG
ncbi:MAG: SRPBCC family protein [Bryobacteraceae bacterium]